MHMHRLDIHNNLNSPSPAQHITYSLIRYVICRLTRYNAEKKSSESENDIVDFIIAIHRNRQQSLQNDTNQSMAGCDHRHCVGQRDGHLLGPWSIN